VGISPLMDTWILLQTMEGAGERNRGLYILKSRGMEHSNQVREFVITGKGVDLADAYLGPEGVLMGSARAAQEARNREQAIRRAQELKDNKRSLKARRAVLESRMAALRRDIDSMDGEMAAIEAEAETQEAALAMARDEMAKLRKAD